MKIHMCELLCFMLSFKVVTSQQYLPSIESSTVLLYACDIVAGEGTKHAGASRRSDVPTIVTFLHHVHLIVLQHF